MGFTRIRRPKERRDALRFLKGGDHTVSLAVDCIWSRKDYRGPPDRRVEAVLARMGDAVGDWLVGFTGIW